MPREFDRRLFLKGLALATPAVVVACGETPPPPRPIEVETAQWPVIDIFPHAVDQANMIPNPSQHMSQDIGLTDLYIINSSSVPYIFALLLFDPRIIKDGLNTDLPPFLKRKLNGLMALQEVGDKFIATNPERIPDDPKAILDPKGFKDQAYRMAGLLLNQKPKSATFAGFVHKHANPDKPVTLVLGEGIVAYKDTPSPLSYLRLKFNFGQGLDKVSK